MGIIKFTPLLATLLQAAVLFQTIPQHAHGANILFTHMMTTASHRTTIWPLAEQLANRGHNVSYIYPLKNRPGSHPKIEELLPSAMTPIVTEFLGDFDINVRLNKTVDEWLGKIFSKNFDLCGALYSSPEIKEWLARPGLHYDLVFIDTALGDCIYGLVHKFKAKHILFSPAIAPYLWDGMGIVPESSSVPPTLGFRFKPDDMGFFARVKTTLAPLIWRMGYLGYLKKLEPFLRETLNITDMPDIVEFEKNASLAMINMHFLEDYPMALPPSVIPISGLSCGKAKTKVINPLPENIAKFIKDSDGFVYVSLGSAIVVSRMPVEFRDHFLQAFGAFPNLKFLWRWTGPVPENAPKNILFQSWFPQNDILAHPKIKGFIMQGGRPSTQEALCHGVPLINIPIFGDQEYNSDRTEYLGVSIIVEVEDLSEEKLRDSIKELTETDKYSNRMKELSAMYRDRAVDPLDNAVHWTEYALRHDTRLLRSLGARQTWWERRLLDVYAFLTAALITIFGVFGAGCYFLLKFVFRKFVAGDNGSKRKVD